MILATTAYATYLIGITPQKKTTRRLVIQAIQYRQERILNKTINDFPFVLFSKYDLSDY
jgi:hypothetical protein